MGDEQFVSLCGDLKFDTQMQPTPIKYTDEDYGRLIIDGIKGLFTDLVNSEGYDKVFNETDCSFSRKLLLTEREYILLKAHFYFLKMVQADVNTIVGYSTDSLTVTNADKPYANLANEIERIEKRLVEVFFKVRLESGNLA